MPRLFPMAGLALALGLAGCSHYPVAPQTASVAPPWPDEISDLRPDPAVRWGRLENGLRFAVLPHGTPQQRASVVLLVQSGSFHELDDERGYAHFVEHMAFRDLRKFPGQTAFATLQRLGAGPHVNAETGMFETRYYFHQLPVQDSDSLPTALRLMRAIADGIEFHPDAVEQERGVVFGEQRSREAMLTMQARPDELEFVPPREALPRWPELTSLFEGSRVAERHPIGVTEALSAATDRKLRAFYERWYRPERMILVVAGDVEAAPVEQRIRQTFSTITARGRPAPEPVLDPPKNPGGLQIFDTEAEPVTLISLGVVREGRAADDATARQRSLARRLALGMLARRLHRVVTSAESPFISTEVFSSHYVPSRELVLIRAGARPADWKKAITTIDYEVRRANELGFHPTEFELAARRETVHVEAAARQAEHVSSSELSMSLAESIARGVVFTSAEEDRRLTAAQLATMDVNECTKAFRDLLWSGEWAMALIRPPGEPDANSVTFDFKESREAVLWPYKPPVLPRPFPFTEFGPPGEVIANVHSVAIDTQLVRFANGVRLNLKRTRFEPGQVRIGIRLEGGRLACPPDKPGLDLRTFAWMYGGLRDFPLEELNNLWAERIRDVKFGLGATAFGFTARVDAENMPLLFQAGAAYFVRPDLSVRSGRRALEVARQSLAPYTSTAVGVGDFGVWQRMSGGHPVYRIGTIQEASERTLDELKEWFEPQLASAPLEIGVIGDFDPAFVIDACARTFGALPARATDDPVAERRRTQLPVASFSETVDFNGTKGVTAVSLAWPAPELARFPAQFRGHILASILQIRLSQKLRTEMGETYSPAASLSVEDALVPAVSFLRCTIEAAPDRTEIVAAAAREIAATLARKGITPDELERARRPLVRETETGLRNNQWWFDVVTVAQSNPAYGDGWARAAEEYQSTTREEINALAARVLDPARLSQLVVRPAE